MMMPDPEHVVLAAPEDNALSPMSAAQSGAALVRLQRSMSAQQQTLGG